MFEARLTQEHIARAKLASSLSLSLSHNFAGRCTVQCNLPRSTGTMGKLPNFSNKSNEAKDKIVMSAEIEKFMRLRSSGEEGSQLLGKRIASRAFPPLFFKIRRAFLIICTSLRVCLLERIMYKISSKRRRKICWKLNLWKSI